MITAEGIYNVLMGFESFTLSEFLTITIHSGCATSALFIIELIGIYCLSFTSSSAKCGKVIASIKLR